MSSALDHEPEYSITWRCPRYILPMHQLEVFVEENSVAVELEVQQEVQTGLAHEDKVVLHETGHICFS